MRAMERMRERRGGGSGGVGKIEMRDLWETREKGVRWREGGGIILVQGVRGRGGEVMKEIDLRCVVVRTSAEAAEHAFRVLVHSGHGVGGTNDRGNMHSPARGRPGIRARKESTEQQELSTAEQNRKKKDTKGLLLSGDA